jgi:hypothetical protein
VGSDGSDLIVTIRLSDLSDSYDPDLTDGRERRGVLTGGMADGEVRRTGDPRRGGCGGSW